MEPKESPTASMPGGDSLETSTGDDRLGGAHGRAGAAIDALGGIDPTSAVLLADSLDGALGLAGSAIDARIGDLIGHWDTSLMVVVCEYYTTAGVGLASVLASGLRMGYFND